MADEMPWDRDWSAPALSKPWEMDWNPSAQAPAAAAAPSVGADVAKSAVTGIARDAPIAAMTALPSMWDLAAKGVEYLVHKAAPDSTFDLGLAGARHFVERDPAGLRALADRSNDPEIKKHFLDQAAKLENDPELNNALRRRMHRFQDVSEDITKAGIPDYEAQTTPGRYAKVIAEGVPLALTGGGGAGTQVANVVKNAVLPGAASEAAGNKFQGTWLETPARIAGAIAGGVAGHGADVARSAIRTGSVARDVAGQARDLTGSPEINAGAVRRVAKNVADDSVTPETAQARMGELGPEGMLLDTGRQLQGRAEAIAAQPGPGQNRVLNAVENRTGEFGEGTANRVRGTLNEHMGPPVNVVELEKGIGDIVDRHARPLYQSVMAEHPVVDVPASITERPAVAAAMKNATTLAKQYGEKLESPTETQTIIKGPGYHIADETTAPARTSLQYWDYVKKDLDRRINSYMKSGGSSELNSADKADLGGLIDARNALRNHLDQTTNGAYKTARDVWAHKPQLTEALNDGRGALGTKLLPEELADQYHNLSIPQQAMFRTGMRREIDRVMDTARNDGAAARRILDTDQNREKIATVFGQRAAVEIDRRIAAETTFQDATNKVSANSRTAVRRNLVKDTEEPSAATPPQANILGYAHKAATNLLQNLRNTGMENTRTGIGNLVTTPAAQVPDLVRLLAEYNQRAAAMAPPTVMRSASDLARTLALPALANTSQNAQQQR